MEELGDEAKVITTVQCSICSQPNNKPRVVDTIPAIIYGFTKWFLYYAPINDLPHPPIPHAGKGGDRLGIYLIVEVNPWGQFIG